MWLLSLLPDWIFHLITIAGMVGIVAGFVLGFIPLIKRYQFPIQVLSIPVLLFGIYMEGGLANEDKWQLKVKEVEAQVAKKETKAAEATVKIITKYVTKVQVVKEKTNANVREVTKYITKEVDSGCVIPDDFRVLHSRASGNEVSDSASGSNGTSAK